jgi:hypothetical protein
MDAKQIGGVIVALCVAVVAARADSLELKNGSLIKGKFMGGTQASITKRKHTRGTPNTSRKR